MAFKSVNGKLVKTTRATRFSPAAISSFNEFVAVGQIVQLSNGNYMMRNPDPSAPANILDEVGFTRAALLEQIDRFSKLH